MSDDEIANMVINASTVMLGAITIGIIGSATAQLINKLNSQNAEDAYKWRTFGMQSPCLNKHKKDTTHDR
jgi:hypothetical protein